MAEGKGVEPSRRFTARLFSRQFSSPIDLTFQYLVDEVGVEPTQRLRVGYSHLGSPMPSSSINLVEAVGIEPTVFPMSLIYSQLPSPLSTHLHNFSHTLSNVCNKTLFAMQVHCCAGNVKSALLRYHLYSCVIADSFIR